MITRLTQKETSNIYKASDIKLKSPIFIFGCGRSGTTLLLNILGKHPNIYPVKEESNLFVRHKTTNNFFFEEYEKESNFEKLTLAILASFFYHGDKSSLMIKNNCFPDDVINMFSCIKVLDDFKTLRNKYEVFNLCTHYLTLKENKRRWVEKTPNNIFNTSFILDLYPDAKFIEIYRDPRAVCLSWLNAKFGYFKTSNLLECIKVWRSAISQGLDSRNKIPERYIQVKYEDLINSPKDELKRICDFIGEEFDPCMLDVEIVSNFFQDLEKEKGISKIPLYRWTKIFKSHELLFVDLLTKKYRQNLNYPDSGVKLNIFNFLPFLLFSIKECFRGRKQLIYYFKSKLRFNLFHDFFV